MGGLINLKPNLETKNCWRDEHRGHNPSAFRCPDIGGMSAALAHFIARSIKVTWSANVGNYVGGMRSHD